jgi:hypothetical protein
MSPRVFKEGEFIFWFHSYDVLTKAERAFTSARVHKMTQAMLKSGLSQRLKSDDLDVRSVAAS